MRLRPHPGQVQSPRDLRELLEGSTLADIPYHLVPKFRQWLPDSWDTEASRELRFDIGWDWVPCDQRHGREKFYKRFRPFRGGKKHQPQDSYSLRCMPQVHGAVRDAVAQARARARHRAQFGHRQSAGVPGQGGCRARRGAGDLRRPFPWHAAGAGDELRQGGDPGAGVDLRAPPQQAGRSGHQRRPAGIPDRQRGRHRVRAT